MKNFNIKTRTIKSLKEEEIPSGTAIIICGGIRSSIPYPGFVRTASNKQSSKQDDQSFISILDYP